MAGIDKIYGTAEQYEKLETWLRENKPSYCIYLYDIPERFYYPSSIFPISNFSVKADVWLWQNCPLTFVKERISEQYNGEPK